MIKDCVVAVLPDQATLVKSTLILATNLLKIIPPY